MTDFLNKIGKLAAKGDSLQRAVVPTRILQFDADFACYEAADLEEPVAKNFKELIKLVNYRRNLVGAAFANNFLTLGQKSGREQLASVKPYQENRDPDAPIKVRVRELRALLAEYKDQHMKAIPSYFMEADDLMCREQERMIKEGRVADSILMSGDKDLWMVQGYHADAKTGRIWLVDGYGNTSYREVGNVKPKLVGEGTSWFWHQMIMGDKVDNIPGLEKIDHTTLDKYLPLKTGKPRKDGSAACGEAKAVAILEGVTDEKLAMRRTWYAYVDYYENAAAVRFVEQAYLLWMQRDENLWDVLVYLKSLGMHVEPTKHQRAKIQEFQDALTSASK